MDNRTEILDLRTAISVLKELKGQIIETEVEVDPEAELAGVYRYVGAGGTVMRPTNVNGPAMIFKNVLGHPNTSVVTGLLASRERVGILLGCEKEKLGKLLCECALNPVMRHAIG